MDRRRVLAASAFVAIVLAGIDGQFLLLPFIDRSALAERARAEADRGWYPVYPRFLAAVRAHTKPGTTVAVIAPPTRWDAGYDYAFYRASYFLAGRTVLPVIDREDRPHPENVRTADYLSVWGRGWSAADRTVLWRGEGGALLGRR